MLTKSNIVELLRNNDKAVARALVVLTERQTLDEQANETTKHQNGRGFRPAHARMGTSMAKFYSRNNYLSPKQIAYWRAPQKDGKMRIEIYAGQLLDEAIAKSNKQAEIKFENPYVGQDIGNLEEEKMLLVERLEILEEDYNICAQANDSEEMLESMNLEMIALRKKISQIHEAIRNNFK